MALKQVIPLLNTPEVDSLLGFTTDILGFTDGWTLPGSDGEKTPYAGAKFEGADFHFQLANDAPAGMQTYVHIDDVDALYASLKEKGANVTEPVDQFYGMRDFSVTGPEGTVIGFGSTLEATQS